jgi:amino acid permease
VLLRRYFAECCIFAYTMFNIIGRLIILASFVTTSFASWHLGSVLVERWFVILMVSIVVFPLTMLRKIDALKFTSFISLVCVLFTAVTVIIMFDFTKGRLGMLWVG